MNSQEAVPLAYLEQGMIEAQDKVTYGIRFQNLPWLYTAIYDPEVLDKLLKDLGQTEPIA